MQIRPMFELDLPGVLELYREFYQEAVPVQACSFSSDKILQMCWEILGSPYFLGLVAVADDGQIAGILAAQIVEPFYSKDLVTFEKSFYIRKQYRGGATWSRMIDYYKKWAMGYKVKQVGIGSNSGLKQGGIARLYQRKGFELLGQNFIFVPE